MVDLLQLVFGPLELDGNLGLLAILVVVVVHFTERDMDRMDWMDLLCVRVILILTVFFSQF